MTGDTEKAAMRVSECVRRRRAREEEIREQTEGFDDHGLPLADSEDVDRTVAYLEAVDEEQAAIEAFRDSLLPR